MANQGQANKLELLSVRNRQHTLFRQLVKDQVNLKLDQERLTRKTCVEKKESETCDLQLTEMEHITETLNQLLQSQDHLLLAFGEDAGRKSMNLEADVEAYHSISHVLQYLLNKRQNNLLVQDNDLSVKLHLVNLNVEAAKQAVLSETEAQAVLETLTNNFINEPESSEDIFKTDISMTVGNLQVIHNHFLNICTDSHAK